MTHSQATTSFVLAAIWTAAGCDMSQPANQPSVHPVQRGLPAVSQTNDDAERLLRVDLDDPEVALAPLFPEVFTRARKLRHIKQSRTVVIYCDEPPIEVSVVTEGLTLSRMSDERCFLSIHGIPATLADTAKAGKAFCRLFESPQEAEAAIDEWVIDHETRIDQTLSFIHDFHGHRVELDLRSSFQADLPFRVYAEIYFGTPKPSSPEDSTGEDSTGAIHLD